MRGLDGELMWARISHKKNTDTHEEHARRMRKKWGRRNEETRFPKETFQNETAKKQYSSGFDVVLMCMGPGALGVGFCQDKAS